MHQKEIADGFRLAIKDIRSPLNRGNAFRNVAAGCLCRNASTFFSLPNFILYERSVVHVLYRRVAEVVRSMSNRLRNIKGYPSAQLMSSGLFRMEGFRGIYRDEVECYPRQHR